MISYNYDDNNGIIKVDFNFIKKIFLNYDSLSQDKRNKLMFTEDSIYSSSRLKGSKRLMDVINKYYPNNYEVRITDGTANIGTDSINMGTIYKKINSIEISKVNYNALSNNIKVFDLEDKIKCYNSDINIKIKDLEQDIIYIDAPWGGKEYKNDSNINLYLGNVEITDFYLNNRNKAETFIFKVPLNYNFNNLYSKVINSKIFKHSYKKGAIIKYYLLVITKNENINLE